jgi:hypothetical protein
LRNDPYSVAALTMCGEVYTVLERHDEAEKVLLRAIHISAKLSRPPSTGTRVRRPG